jgi:hypothetical protein
MILSNISRLLGRRYGKTARFDHKTDKSQVAILSVVGMAATCSSMALTAPLTSAVIGEDSNWPLWTALPVAPYSRRKTIRRDAGPGVWMFDQLIWNLLCQVPIALTICQNELWTFLSMHRETNQRCLSFNH